MKFKIDENLPAELASDLIATGYDAQTVFEEGLAGSSDPTLIDHVRREQRILLTMDKGIGDIRAYPPEQFTGIVLFRPKTQGRNETLAFVRRYLSNLLAIELTGHLIVVTDAGIRIR